MTDKFTCFTCGYEWTRGTDGSHDCVYYVKKQLVAAKQTIERMLKREDGAELLGASHMRVIAERAMRELEREMRRSLALSKTSQPEQPSLENLPALSDHLKAVMPEPSAENAANAAPVNKQTTGIYGKFIVRRVDGADAPGCKHHGCRQYVLDVDHDPHAGPALFAYAESCGKEYPLLAEDLRSWAMDNACRLGGNGRNRHAPVAQSELLECLSALVYWNSQGSIDPSWWDEAKRLVTQSQEGE